MLVDCGRRSEQEYCTGLLEISCWPFRLLSGTIWRALSVEMEEDQEHG